MTATSGWERLRLLFQDECLAYEHLTELLHEERSVLRQSDYLALLDVSRRKEVVLIRIRSIEEERVDCVKMLQPATAPEEPLAWVAQSTSPEAGPAKDVLKQLVAVGQQVKKLSEQNTGLISRGLQIVRDAMHIVQEGLGAKPLYGESGCLTFSSATTSLNVEG
ncbi:MAG: hypothetical protein NPIRA04_08660 [Nitrospirales bacterium]|nr:MAG: hypothetical protein NPIRA04_08660 [Nitrospirales bacterium]